MALKKKAAPVQKIVKKQVATNVVAQGNTKVKQRGDYIPTVGRRKTSIARVRLYRGSGTAEVNGKTFESYFGSWIDRNVVVEPLFVTGTDKAVYFTAKVLGGGTKSQAQAISHGISRALVKLSEEHKSLLRKRGLLTRDPRMRETRKIGTGGKARRTKQSPKR